MELTEQEAFKILHPDTTVESIAEIKYYAGFKGREAGIKAVEDACVVACEALEKQMSKKPDYEGDGYDENGNLIYDYAKCPICGHDFEEGINDWGCGYCSDCGQKLDWGE